jgi:hypothetical protein
MMSAGNYTISRQPARFDTSLPECDGKVHRTFTMGGASWLVCEFPCAVSGRPTLVFFGPGMARRIRSYPPHWHSMTESELYALSWTR